MGAKTFICSNLNHGVSVSPSGDSDDSDNQHNESEFDVGLVGEASHRLDDSSMSEQTDSHDLSMSERTDSNDSSMFKQPNSHDSSTSELTDSHDSYIVTGGDFGKVVHVKACRKLTDNEKYNLMKYHFVPARNYKFPSRSFNGHPRFFRQLLPSEVVNKTSMSLDDFATISLFYEDDFPSINPFEAELDLWHCKWRRERDLAPKIDTLGKTLLHADSDYFPNIRTMLVIAATLPVTSCECERSISALRLLKTSLRSTMSQERLNGLAMLQYHKDIIITPEQAVEEFTRLQPRRLYMVNPFSD